MKLIEKGEFGGLISDGYSIVDARKTEVFCDGFFRGAVSVPFNENFINVFQELIESELKVLVITDEEDIAPISKQITAVGIQNVYGFLKGGFDKSQTTSKTLDLLISIDVEEFAIDYRFDEFYLIDVRLAEDFEKEHLEDAENVALNDLEQLLIDLDPSESYYIYANSFAEAVTAGSIFRRDGFEKVKIVADSYENIKSANLPLAGSDKKKTSSTKFSNN